MVPPSVLYFCSLSLSLSTDGLPPTLQTCQGALPAPWPSLSEACLLHQVVVPDALFSTGLLLSTSEPLSLPLSGKSPWLSSSSSSPVTSNSTPAPPGLTPSGAYAPGSPALDKGDQLQCDACLHWCHCKCVRIPVALANSYPFICPHQALRCLFSMPPRFVLVFSAWRTGSTP